MSHKTRRAGSPWRGGLAVALAAACLSAIAWTAPASASSERFCPVGTGTISIGGGGSCTNTTHNALTMVEYYNPGVYWHCASGNASPSGTGSSLIASVCGYGDGGSGRVQTGSFALGTWSYARGSNSDPSTQSGFYGIRYWVP